MKNQKWVPDVQDFLKWRNNSITPLVLAGSSVRELLDSLSSNLQASSVAELSLNPLFRRDYNSLYKVFKIFYLLQLLPILKSC
jgi:hypothetical protein